MKKNSWFLIVLGLSFNALPVMANDEGQRDKGAEGQRFFAAKEILATKAERLKGDPLLAFGVTGGKKDVYINNVRFTTSRHAHRVVAGGTLLSDDSEKNQKLSEHRRNRRFASSAKNNSARAVFLISESSFSRSPNNPGLDFFGSFFEDRATKNSPVDCLAKGPGGALEKKNIQQTITGTVRDAQGPMPGVTVGIKDSNIVVLTDENGRYVISAAVDDVLVFSYVGYSQFEVAVAAGSTVVDVLLREDATALQEVTVNAGYYTVRERERSGSISKITAKDIENQPVTNFLATMQGRMAGVDIIQSSGIAGSGFEIKIRGQNSLRADGNAPLYIIDGVPYSSEALGVGYTNTVMNMPSSPLANINPGDIESIEVLKDADATAIYGSRGANGVVLVTTKKGKSGKARLTLNLNRGTGKVTRFMDMMDTEQYLAMREAAYANDGITAYPANAYDVNGTWDRDRYTDWQRELTGGTAQFTSVNAAVSGGSELTQFMISGNYAKETTVFPGDFAYQKGNVRMNGNHESADRRFRTSFSAGYTHQDNDQPSRDYTVESRTLAPNAPALYDAEGNLNWENGTFSNPLRHLKGKSLAKTHDLVANALFGYRLLPGLELRSSFGFTDLRHVESSTQPSTVYNPALGLGAQYSSISLGTATRQSWIAEPQLQYKTAFGKARLDLLAGATFQSQTGRQLVQRANGFTSNNLIYNLAAATTVATDMDQTTIYKYQAFFGRANIIWNERYIVNLTGRRDGSSRFGPGKQFANFGAVGAAWLFGAEKLFDNSVLSFGKLRASYGIAGNDQIGNYQFLDTYSTTGGNYQGIIGLQPTRLFNPDFAWESNRKLEVGLEAGFFKDRIFVTAAAFMNRSSNQLVGVPLPGTTGFTSIQANLDATVDNKGFELALRAVTIQKADLSWTTSLNLTVTKNKLVSFPGLEASTYANQFVVGEPLNIRKVYRYLGVDPQTGLYRFEDKNGDGVLNVADRTHVADLNPEFYGGLQNQLRYKNWNLDFLFQFVKQQKYNTASLGIPGTMGNQSADLANHWQQEGDTAAYQQFTSGTNAAVTQGYVNFLSSDGVITDGSFIRLKNISLSYEVPRGWIDGLGCRVVLEGQNLTTFTRYKGADPEFTGSNSLPPLRIVTAGLQLTF